MLAGGGVGYYVREAAGGFRYAVTVHYETWPGLEELRSLDGLGLRTDYHYSYVPALGVRNASFGQLEDLTRLPGVTRIDLMPVFVPALDTSTRVVGARSAQGSGDCGEGAVIAVLDTGIDVSHESLDDLDDNRLTDNPKVIASVDFSTGSPLAAAPAVGERAPFGVGGDDAMASVNAPLAGLVLSDPGTFAAWGVDHATTDPSVLLDGGSLFTAVYHGTHVASIAAGTSGSHPEYRGVAPCAKLVNVKVLSGTGWGVNVHRREMPFGFGVQAGIEWVLDYNSGLTSFGDPGEDRIDVVNLSLASALCSPTNGVSVTERLIEKLVARGVNVVVAAGNCGSAGVTEPGGAPSAITVGAFDDNDTPDPGDDTVAPFSGRGGGGSPASTKKPELLAPGVSIVAASGVLASPAYRAADAVGATAQYDALASQETWLLGPDQGVGVLARSRYHPMSGTSMAAPHAAGAVGLVLERSPDASPRDVKEALLMAANADSWSPNAGCSPWNLEWGCGRLSADAMASESGIPPDVGILDASRALRNGENPLEVRLGELRLFAKANSGTLTTLKMRVNGGPWTPLPPPPSTDPYVTVKAPGNEALVEVEATNSYGKTVRTSAIVARHASMDATPPRHFASSADRVYAHLRPGGEARVAAPDGRTLNIYYSPPASAIGDSTGGSPLRVDDALAVVVDVSLDGAVQGVRHAYAQYDDVPLDPASFETVGSLAGSPVDGTWLVASGRNGLGVPAGVQLQVQGLVFDHVYDGHCALIHSSGVTLFTESSGDITTGGSGEFAGDLVSGVKAWNWHKQSELAITRYDTACPTDPGNHGPVHVVESAQYQRSYVPSPAGHVGVNPTGEVPP